MDQNQSSLSQLRILHLAGSSVSEFFYRLSLIYVQEVVQPPGVQSYYALVNPDGYWQLGTSLENLSQKMSFRDAIAQLPQIDVVVPHLFCVPGLTSYRSFFEDVLRLPVVGSPANCTSLSIDKYLTKSIVSASGVRVANGQLLRRGDTVKIKPPFIVKPNSKDNSVGLSLVRNQTQIAEALRIGFEQEETLLIENYIPGRELRVGVVELKGKLSVLPIIEYVFGSDSSIRSLDDKLELGADGLPHKQPQKPAAKPICPAKVDSELFEKVATAAKRAHRALGCRDYSLYDFRVETKTNEPYFLEAGLFWSFGHNSMISRMLVADGQNLSDVAEKLWRTVAKRSHRDDFSVQGESRSLVGQL
ncbi:MAG: D-alanine--D-alanine ligase [Oscillatoria sp. PMC 1068.18]|nr:D-alanine--D-alanine ligase [Oscillatoria sp. PMC 1076.18]MEC4987340.1 D-alanine--D-alanine ligase [Oscillatoria sp. PMC 1068.18]